MQEVGVVQGLPAGRASVGSAPQMNPAERVSPTPQPFAREGAIQLIGVIADEAGLKQAITGRSSAMTSVLNP